MSQDLYQYAREQLAQAMQEQAMLAQEKAIHASLDFIRSMRALETMPCKPLTTEELDKIREGILNLAYEELQCDECAMPAKNARKCDNCGDVLCEDCCYYSKDDHYEDNDVAFCFGCWTEHQSTQDEEVE